MTELVRSIEIRKQDRYVHAGPVGGGCFWALATVNDLPANHRLARADAAYLLRHGDLYMQDATRPGTWRAVTSTAELGGFSASLEDKYEACETRFIARPYLPELYFVPRTWRGLRAIRRAESRARRIS